MESNLQFYAYFLPQFYSTPENDLFWGKGFTEWTNVRKANPLFEGHRSPLLPINENYYDLSDSEQLKGVIARTVRCGLDGVVYWHYWFGKGKYTLDLIPRMHLENHLEQNFFFAWDNKDWTQSWIGKKENIIFKQFYERNDVSKHVSFLEPFFESGKYVKRAGRPIVQVNHPNSRGVVPYIFEFDREYRNRYGKGIFWLFPLHATPKALHQLHHRFILFPPGGIQGMSFRYNLNKLINHLLPNSWGLPFKLSSSAYLRLLNKILHKYESSNRVIPTILSGWDTSYRYGRKGMIIDERIGKFIEQQLDFFSIKKLLIDKSIILIKSFNEWAEGNILENHSYMGKEYLLEEEVLKLINEYKNKFIKTYL